MQSSYGVEEIQTVPLINLEELSPTFEEEKDELEKIENQKNNLNNYNISCSIFLFRYAKVKITT